LDPERWPKKIHEIVDALTCPRCGEPKRGPKGIFVVMRYMLPVWTIQSECWQCGQTWFWNISPTTEAGVEYLAPLPAPSKPESELQPTGIKAPDWWKEIGQ